MSTPLLEFMNVTKAYGHKEALTNVNFALERGKIVGLLGPNGSGKTTIMKLINGLIQPTSGTVLINGIAPGIDSKKAISFLPDRTYLNNWMRVRDTFDMFGDFYTDFDRVKAEDMLKSLQIDGSAPLKSLSKGTLEKVQLILVMARKAQLYLLDEPIAGVDPAARDYILRTILNNYGDDSTILLSTHLITDVEKIFEHVLFIKNGQIDLQGNVDDIRAQYNNSIDGLFREVYKC